ncbi:hypothetical protein K432DRAFT_386727 [Lepidopterella palustris CBS 459.81]|uniref:Response regulatory domain-containing protein n=1 Tax=Lepidopterella palustris CBS 459.81 TaxID=1314670 RepID=A0A8E2DZR6_9PEZI|nr:hypothetical protein K432DRAFT_386727 [Lepidopterella palustris CBS 459.81]
MWNGKEALDYLLQEPSLEYLRPDIILVDVQVSVMDGYRAMRTIRTEGPFKVSVRIRNIPIVAMTASAIQGDSRKVPEGWSDDCLAKPEKGKLLEKMLLKWATEGRRKQKLAEAEEDQQRTSVVRNTCQRGTHKALS